MSKSKRLRRKAALAHPDRPKPIRGVGARSEVPTLARLAGWRRYAARAALAILVPVVFLAGLELALRLFQYGYSPRFFLKLAGTNAYTVNEHFARQFYLGGAARGKSHPFLMPAEKQTNTIRIFILGESAALGTPDPSYSFGRILEAMLRTRYPETRFEVLNAAMRGINSYIVLPIAKECAKYQPDLFVVYQGNNEVIGLHAPGPETGFLHRNLTLIRAIQALRSTRLGHLFIATLGRQSPGPDEQDMEFFREHRLAADDPRRMMVFRHFRANLEEMCKAMTQSSAKVILSTIGANLLDFAPLASLHRSDWTETEKAQWEAAYARGVAAEAERDYDKAIGEYANAARLDDHFAELHFRWAGCYLATDRPDKARDHFSLARDWDALQFRADSRINKIIHDVASANATRGVSFVDAEELFAQSINRGIPGDDLFYDHVHFSFEGGYLLARTLYPAVEAALHARLGTHAKVDAPLPSRQECADALALTSWDELQMELSMLKLKARAPFLDQLDHQQRQFLADQKLQDRKRKWQRADFERARRVYQAAIERDPTDWQLHHNFGTFCHLNGDFAAAAEHLAVAVTTFPNSASHRVALGAALGKAGKNQEALFHFQEALRLDPHYPLAKEAVTALKARVERRGL